VKNVLAVILGGGRGTRLFPLTKFRSKPAVPIGGKFRLIDIPISNCLHWNIRKIFILTQFNTASLHRHLTQTYRFDSFSEGFLHVLAAQQTLENSNWYQGTADAVRQNLSYIKELRVDYVVILSGDQLYRINLKEFLEFHIRKKSDVTIATKIISRENVSDFGIMEINPDQTIVDFVEKPRQPEIIERFRIPDDLRDELKIEKEGFLASMGIYVFNKDFLVKLLRENLEEDFGKQVIPYCIQKYRVAAFLFDGYWEDVGTIRTFFEANIDFGNPLPRFNFYDENFPIYTRKRFLPGSKIENCQINYSLISDGSIIEGSKITNSVIGLRAIIRANSYLERVVMMGADFYESPQELEENRKKGRIPIGIGYNCVIKNAILDKNVRIGSNVLLINEKGLTNYETDRYSIIDGIIVVPKDMEIPDNYVI